MQYRLATSVAAALGALLLGACSSNPEATSTTNNAAVPDYWPSIQSPIAKSDEVEKKVSEMLATMTVKQKVAQIVQPEIRDVTVEDMREYGFGSYLNGGGSFPNNNKHAT
ncbi:MAG: glycoside hydrolase family 3 protein, partial [Pseudomonadota bacterium]|nr:glycoside hydrolase family 3 protein [Pseudomonadota bacterium]